VDTEFTKDEQAAYLFGKASIVLYVGVIIGWLTDLCVRAFF
jgi:hypothetical protein